MDITASRRFLTGLFDVNMAIARARTEGMAPSFMIAVTGGSGSGKTTLARALYARLGPHKCQLVTEDHYYFGRAHYGPAALAMQNAELEQTFNFDDPANKDMAHLRRDIEALKRGESVEQPVYDFPRHDRKPGVTMRVDARPVVVVEERI